MKIVLTHISPDFDAIASAYAACKLLSCDHIAMISGFEPNVLEFLEDKKGYIPIKQYTEKEIGEIKEIEHLIITDCKQLKRLGKLSELIKIAKKITIYDHHPAYAKDIEADEEFVETIGSATSILVRFLKEANIELNRFEATLLAMGIYEDTGLFTFKSTTVKDAEALAYLISQNADTTSISEYIKRDLSRTQVLILNELLLNLTTISANDVDVSISYAMSDDYLDEMSYLCERLMSIEGLDSLFILIATGGRVVLIGRSKTSKVDLSSVISQIGGGGHAAAASAIIKDMMVQEALDSLRHIIREKIRPVKTVGDIMNSPVKYVISGTSFEEAQAIIRKYNLNHMPVVADNRVIGIMSRKDIFNGIKHGLRAEPVNDVMQVEFDIVAPDTPYYMVEEIMLAKEQEILPVEDETGLIGVVTRTDMLRFIHEETVLRSSFADRAREDLGIAKSKNVKSLLKEHLPDDILKLLEEVGKYASEKSLKAYVVGGFVRDLLMKRENFDIDIVVEGDAVKFASEFGLKYNAKVAVHTKFKTAVVIMDGGFKVDFATARTEYYVTPAALPEVEEASIKNDLFRRDFTINAMAIRLDGSHYGLLLDFFSGQKDINDKKIRALHSLSFVDDPTRAFRAIRFAVRFSFEIGSHTERLIKHAESLNLFGKILGFRLFTELKYILLEKGYAKALIMMKKYNLLRFYSNMITLDEDIFESFNRLEELLSWYHIQLGRDIEVWRARFILLFLRLDRHTFEETVEKFDLSDKIMLEILNDYKINYALSTIKKHKDIKPSQVYKILKKFSDEALLALAALLSSRQEIVKDYFTIYSDMQTCLGGNDLISLGVEQGQKIGEYLEKLRDAKLDGELETQCDEINFIKSIMEQK